MLRSKSLCFFACVFAGSLAAQTADVRSAWASISANLIAAAVKVNGWVRACNNGNVEACFEGNRRDVEALVSWCFVGPRLARVEEVIVRPISYRGSYCDFRILDDTAAARQEYQTAATMDPNLKQAKEALSRLK